MKFFRGSEVLGILAAAFLLSTAGVSTGMACPDPGHRTPPRGCQLQSEVKNSCTIYHVVCPHPGHSDSNTISYTLTDSGGWFYDRNPTSPTYGRIAPNCNHLDLKGTVWSTE